MLVLARMVNESIIIEGGIRITVMRTGKGKVRLGITCPGTILREEIATPEQLTKLAQVNNSNSTDLFKPKT